MIDLTAYMMNLKGKQYLPVAPRIVAFREVNPAWSIITEPTSINDAPFCRATIMDDTGRVISTAHKAVTSFAGGAFEKAETGAIGRALSLCGFGTIAALDMDEGEDISDAPVAAPAKPAAKPAPIDNEVQDWLIILNEAQTADDLAAFSESVKGQPKHIRDAVRGPFMEAKRLLGEANNQETQS